MQLSKHWYLKIVSSFFIFKSWLLIIDTRKGAWTSIMWFMGNYVFFVVTLLSFWVFCLCFMFLIYFLGIFFGLFQFLCQLLLLCFSRYTLPQYKYILDSFILCQILVRLLCLAVRAVVATWLLFFPFLPLKRLQCFNEIKVTLGKIQNYLLNRLFHTSTAWCKMFIRNLKWRHWIKTS